MSEDLKAVVAAITAAWREGRFDELRDHFHPDAVLAQPGFGRRITGRDAIIASYKEFANEARVLSFTSGEVSIDDTGEGAVTTMPWRMEYEIDGTRYDESGWDLLVFVRREGRWVVVWRTVVVES